MRASVDPVLQAAIDWELALNAATGAAGSPQEAREIANKMTRERASGGVTDDLTTEADELGGIPARWVSTRDSGQLPVVFFVHGGGFIFGGSDLDDVLLSRLAAATGGRAVSVDYRLAPEDPYPAALDDVEAAYLALIAQFAPDQVVVVGESAGGALAVQLLQRARDGGQPMPAGVVLISPMVDFTASGESIEKNSDDPLVNKDVVMGMAGGWLQGRDLAEYSPLFGDLSALPPLLVQVGVDEALHDDSSRLVQRCQAAGVDAHLEEWEDVLHLWQGFPELEQAAAATASAADFIRRATATVTAN